MKDADIVNNAVREALRCPHDKGREQIIARVPYHLREKARFMLKHKQQAGK